MRARLAAWVAAGLVLGLNCCGFVDGVAAKPTGPTPSPSSHGKSSDDGSSDGLPGDYAGVTSDENGGLWAVAGEYIPGTLKPGTPFAADSSGDGQPVEYYASVVCDPDSSYKYGDETCNRRTEPLCDEPDEQYVDFYQRPAGQPGAPWTYLGSGCDGDDPSTRPTLTPARVLEAVRRIGLPANSFEVPPETLVNYETTVYTEASTFNRTVNILGYTVEVRAELTSFQWVYGDGEVEVTKGPGAPYPSDAITHTWLDAHRTLRPRVDTTYTVSYRVDGGPWLDVGEPLVVQGDPATVRIREASAVLADMR